MMRDSAPDAADDASGIVTIELATATHTVDGHPALIALPLPPEDVAVALHGGDSDDGAKMPWVAIMGLGLAFGAHRRVRRGRKRATRGRLCGARGGGGRVAWLAGADGLEQGAGGAGALLREEGGDGHQQVQG